MTVQADRYAHALRQIDEYVNVAGAVKDARPIREILAPLRAELQEHPEAPAHTVAEALAEAARLLKLAEAEATQPTSERLVLVADRWLTLAALHQR